MRKPVTIPLTKDKTRNLIIDLERINAIWDTEKGSSLEYQLSNGNSHIVEGLEFTASELYEEICSPSK